MATLPFYNGPMIVTTPAMPGTSLLAATLPGLAGHQALAESFDPGPGAPESFAALIQPLRGARGTPPLSDKPETLGNVPVIGPGLTAHPPMPGPKSPRQAQEMQTASTTAPETAPDAPATEAAGLSVKPSQVLPAGLVPQQPATPVGQPAQAAPEVWPVMVGQIPELVPEAPSAPLQTVAASAEQVDPAALQPAAQVSAARPALPATKGRVAAAAPDPDRASPGDRPHPVAEGLGDAATAIMPQVLRKPHVRETNPEPAPSPDEADSPAGDTATSRPALAIQPPLPGPGPVETAATGVFADLPPAEPSDTNEPRGARRPRQPHATPAGAVRVAPDSPLQAERPPVALSDEMDQAYTPSTGPDPASPTRPPDQPSAPAPRFEPAPLPAAQPHARTVMETRTTEAPSRSVPEAAPVARPETDLAVSTRNLDGLREVDVRLVKTDLGRVDVRLSIPEKGRLEAVVAADNPAALDLLRREGPELARALTAASPASDGASLSFQSRTSDEQSGRRNPVRTRAATAASADDQPSEWRPMATSGRIERIA